MSIDQILYVAARIHSWDKSPFEIICRAEEIVHDAEIARSAQEEVDRMEAEWRQ